MCNPCKLSVLTLMLLMTVCTGSMPVKAAEAHLEPSIPEFTLRYIDNSYDVPATYGVDQYTGQTVVTVPGEHVDNRSIEIKIKNTPFTPYTDKSGNTINQFYNIRYRSTVSENWITMFGNQTQSAWTGQTNPYSKYGYLIQDYTSEYTTLIYRLTSQTPLAGVFDFQVQTLVGYTIQAPAEGPILFSFAGFTFIGQSSSWSNTQTVRFGDDVSNNSSAATQAPSVPEINFLPVLPVFFGLILAALMLLQRKRRKFWSWSD